MARAMKLNSFAKSEAMIGQIVDHSAQID